MGARKRRRGTTKSSALASALCSGLFLIPLAASVRTIREGIAIARLKLSRYECGADRCYFTAVNMISTAASAPISPVPTVARAGKSFVNVVR
jgi:hypothetical protein